MIDKVARSEITSSTCRAFKNRNLSNMRFSLHLFVCSPFLFRGDMIRTEIWSHMIPSATMIDYQDFDGLGKQSPELS
jgi:hypothetical protein